MFGCSRNQSVLWYRGVHFVRPCKDTTLQVQDLAETCAAQEFHRFRGTLAAAAVSDDLARTIQLVYAARKLAQWNQVSAQITDLKLVRLPDGGEKKKVAPAHPAR